MDTPPEPDFENLVAVARTLCRTPIALISLVHRDRQWFKARIGLDPEQTTLDQSVCAHALSETGLLVIPDMTADPRTRDNPLVTGPPGMRFYAGAPLWLNGAALGTLCVIDTAPRPEGLTPEQATALEALATQVVSQIETRARARQWYAENERQKRSLRQAAVRATALAGLGDRLRATRSVDEAIAAASEVMAQTMGATRAGFGIVDPERETVMMQPEWRAPGVASVAGLHSFRTYGSYIDDLKRGEIVIVPDVAQDPRTQTGAAALLAIGIRVLINVPVLQNGRFVLVVFLHYDWPRPLDDDEVDFIRALGDRIQAAITGLRAQEERQLMNRELGHRLKNTFAMITAIARQTFGSQDRKALRSFSARLAALGGAYDLLAHERWAAADMALVVRNATAVTGGEERVRAEGVPIMLGAEAALSAAMLLHELITNAMKYGALSVPAGHVSLTWAVEGEDLVLAWEERGGPPAAPPTRSGFGSRLIRMGLIGSGKADLDFRAEGLSASFRAPVEHLSR
ncbi:GAF domain-containing protein [Falsirhodobacter algicola]|nr:GAF domain-containing protein [Falsirhodobacter algicola]